MLYPHFGLEKTVSGLKFQSTYSTILLFLHALGEEGYTLHRPLPLFMSLVVVLQRLLVMVTLCSTLGYFGHSYVLVMLCHSCVRNYSIMELGRYLIIFAIGQRYKNSVKWHIVNKIRHSLNRQQQHVSISSTELRDTEYEKYEEEEVLQVSSFNVIMYQWFRNMNSERYYITVFIFRKH